jgi:spermidine synthase
LKTNPATVPESAPTSTPQTSPPAESKALRYYLYATAAVTGAAVMIVEILGAKMLSPYVGMSHFVWTAQIAVTLIALACGYYVGGRLADRSQRLHRLYWAILVAAAWLALSTIICQGVANWALDFNLAVGSLLASAVLFFIPLALLAMTGPFLVRVITSSVAGVGGNVGRLTSLSTLGSFAGTLLIGYFLLPHLPNSATMYFTAMALTLIAAGYFVLFRRSPGALSLVLLFSLATGLSLHWVPQPKYRYVVESFSGNSHFGQLQVLDATDATARLYLNDNLIQNTYDLQLKNSRSAFTYMLSGLARAYTTNLQSALCIGLGVGIVPMDLARRGVQVDVVEINPAIVPVATKFFGLEPDKLHITIDDGRHFLNRCQKQYDVVVLDAFLGDSSPSHLLTREAFASIRKVLRPGGTLVINSFADLAPERDFFTTSLSKTLKAVFPGVRMHYSTTGAAFFVASDHPLTGFAHQPDLAGINPLVHGETVAAFAEVTEARPDHGRVLTDDYNPVEYYDAPNRESVRRRLVEWTKDL